MSAMISGIRGRWSEKCVDLSGSGFTVSYAAQPMRAGRGFGPDKPDGLFGQYPFVRELKGIKSLVTVSGVVSGLNLVGLKWIFN